jgi:hypothetical protein
MLIRRTALRTALMLAPLMTAISGLACASEGIRLLCDFEKESVAKFTKFKKESNNSYSVRVSGYYSCEFTATRGLATSGKWALSRTFPARKDCRYMPGVRDGQHLPSRKLFSTSYSLAKLGPTDWSGFEALEINVCKDKPGPLSIVLAIEDRVICPPLIRRFTLAKEGQWYTLHLKLAPIGEILDLSKVVNFWLIVEESPDKVEVRVDDLRLVKGKIKNRFPLLTDLSPVKESYRKLVKELKEILPGEARHNVPSVKGQVQPSAPPPGTDSRKFTRPAKIEALGLFEKPGGNTRRTYPYGLDFWNDKNAIIRYPSASTACTVDGGKTWRKLAGGFRGVNSWRSEVSGDRGDLLYIGLGQCSGGGAPTSFYFRRLLASQTGWKWGPAYPVDRDTRHCQDHYDILRLNSGRIWTAWNHCQRFGGYGLHAKYSDNDGKTWETAGQTPALPGSIGKCNLKSNPKLLQLGNGVACLWEDRNHQVHFNRHDGKNWSNAVALKTKGLVSVATPDDNTIYAVVGGGRNGKLRILKGGGQIWTENFQPAAKGYLTTQRKSGRVHYVYATGQDAATKVFMVSCEKGKWSVPQKIFTPGQSHAGYQQLSISLSRHSPAEFVPVAIIGTRGKTNWKDVTWIQVIKVPTP